MGPILSDPRLALIGFSRDLLCWTGLAGPFATISMRMITRGESGVRFGTSDDALGGLFGGRTLDGGSIGGGSSKT